MSSENYLHKFSWQLLSIESRIFVIVIRDQKSRCRRSKNVQNLLRNSFLFHPFYEFELHTAARKSSKIRKHQRPLLSKICLYDPVSVKNRGKKSAYRAGLIFCEFALGTHHCVPGMRTRGVSAAVCRISRI
jgi:hypothetical protein